METAVDDQQNIFKNLVKSAKDTEFGKDHGFETIQTHEDFKRQVPFGIMNNLKPYIEKIKQGKHNILWKGKPIYFAKTSGTTSGIKYIPITKDSIPNHINSARNALLCYMAETGNTEICRWKTDFFKRFAGTGKSRRHTYREIKWHSKSSCAKIFTRKSVAVL